MTLTWGGEGLLDFSMCPTRLSFRTDREAPPASWLSLWKLGSHWRASHIVTGTTGVATDAQGALNALRAKLGRARVDIDTALDSGQPVNP